MKPRFTTPSTPSSYPTPEDPQGREEKEINGEELLLSHRSLDGHSSTTRSKQSFYDDFGNRLKNHGMVKPYNRHHYHHHQQPNQPHHLMNHTITRSKMGLVHRRYDQASIQFDEDDEKYDRYHPHTKNPPTKY